MSNQNLFRQILRNEEGIYTPPTLFHFPFLFYPTSSFSILYSGGGSSQVSATPLPPWGADLDPRTGVPIL